MKLHTDIKPRQDGTVIVQGKDKEYVFKPNENGDLEADVDDSNLIEHLLKGENFWPADIADADASLSILGKGDQDPELTTNTTQEPVDDMSDDDANIPDYENGNMPMPIEANTPPKTTNGKKGAGRPRKTA